MFQDSAGVVAAAACGGRRPENSKITGDGGGLTLWFGEGGGG